MLPPVWAGFAGGSLPVRLLPPVRVASPEVRCQIVTSGLIGFAGGRLPLGLLPPVWTASPEVGCRIVTSAEPLFVGGQHPNPRSAPANILSQEKDEYRRAHLRGEARSPEKSTSSYEGCPCRRRRADDALTSAEPLLAGGQHPIARSAPANILSQEEDKYRRAHLRGEARSPEKSASSDKGLLRRR